MPSKNVSSPLLKHYDKVVLGVAAVAFIVSIVFFITTKSATEKRQEAFRNRLETFRIANPDVEDISGDIIATSNLFSRLEKPHIVSQAAMHGSSGFFVPETRVWCAKSDCHAPISPKDKVCPVCGTDQPGEPKPDINADTDGDGIPDMWERKYGFNPLDNSDATADPDDDGFDNLSEYLAGTNPTDPKSHPDVLTMLRLESIEATPLPIRFQSRGMRFQDNHYRSQFNYVNDKTRQDPPSIMVKEGEPLIFNTAVGKVDTGYVFTKLEIKSIERKVEWSTMPQSTEVAFAFIQKGKKIIKLEEGKAASDSNYKITIEQTTDGSILTIDGEDDIFAIGEQNFHVKNVDMENSKVVIEAHDKSVKVEVTKDKAIVTRPKNVQEGKVDALPSSTVTPKVQAEDEQIKK